MNANITEMNMNMNMHMMAQIMKVLNVIPEVWALRGEAVRKVEWQDGEPIALEFSAASMFKVRLGEDGEEGWAVDLGGRLTVFRV